MIVSLSSRCTRHERRSGWVVWFKVRSLSSTVRRRRYDSYI